MLQNWGQEEGIFEGQHLFCGEWDEIAGAGEASALRTRGADWKRPRAWMGRTGPASHSSAAAFAWLHSITINNIGTYCRNKALLPDTSVSLTLKNSHLSKLHIYLESSVDLFRYLCKLWAHLEPFLFSYFHHGFLLVLLSKNVWNTLKINDKY